MPFEDTMNVILPPNNGNNPHVTGNYGEPRGNSSHGGVDFNYQGGQAGINLENPAVHSPVSGTVTYVGGNYGMIGIRDADGNVHQILHTDSQSVQVGDQVNAGDEIGNMGGTGPSGSDQYAQHVHYQMRDENGDPINPQEYWDENDPPTPTPPTPTPPPPTPPPPTPPTPTPPTPTPPPPPPPTPPVPRRDPLALDLDGDGVVRTLPRSHGVHFDLDNSGFAESTSWVDASDGLLVLDRNSNGFIDGGAELFGTETLLSSGEYADNGYLALADFDSNFDEQISSDDAIFADLRVWKDTNSNGVAEAGEMYSLADLGVSTISVRHASNQFTDGNNVQHREESSFTYSDGRTGLTNTLWFDSDRRDTIPVDIHNGTGDDVPADIAALPNAAGFGNAYSLHYAMTYDESGELQALVGAFVAESDPEVRWALIGNILAVWAGQQDTPVDGRGPAMNGRHLGILETFWGQPALQDNPAGLYAESLINVYRGLERSLYSQLMADSHADGLFNLLSFTQVNGTLSGDFSDVADHFAQRFANGDVTAAAELKDFIDVVGGISPYADALSQQFVAALELEARLLPRNVRMAMQEVFRVGNDHLTGTAAGETLMGYAGDDSINGLAGNDDLHGGDGDDELFGGDGADFLIGGVGDDALSGQGGDDVLSGGAGEDVLLGGAGRDLLEGGEGDDELYGDGQYGGAGSNDELDGGAGNDYLVGGFGSDTYLFGRGDGQDLINNDGDGWGSIDPTVGKVDVLQFKEDVLASDLVLSRSGNDLVIKINGTTDQVTLQYYFTDDATSPRGYAVDQIRFADGTTWDVSTVKAMVLQGTSGNDTLTGYATDDTIDGGAGDDTIDGRGGNDTIEGGTGVDYLMGGDGADNVSGGDDGDTLIGGLGDDVLSGGAGNDQLYGSVSAYGGAGGNDVMDGGAGNDYLVGGFGSDTYLFGIGDGQDIINNDGDGWGSVDPTVGKIDVLQFKEGVLASDVTISRSGDDLIVKINGTTDQVTLQYYFTDNAASPRGYAVEQLRFADGTTWDINTVKSKVQQGTEGADVLYASPTGGSIYALGGNDTLHGNAGVDLLDGGAGNDQLNGNDGNDDLRGGDDGDTLIGGLGDDVLSGGAGNDSLFGGGTYGGAGGNDVMDGGAGNDFQVGGFGSDTYRFGIGDGQDTINNDGDGWGSIDPTVGKIDVLQFKEGVLASGVTLTRSGDDLIVKITGTTDQVTLQYYFTADATSPRGYAVDQIRFADGTTWDVATVKAMMLQGTSGNDTLIGYASNDTMNGANGNDTIDGRAGVDLLQGYAGNDTITDTNANGGNLFDGGAGTDTLTGGVGKDLFLGGAGTDTITTSTGADVVAFSRGDGSDLIVASTGGDNTLSLGGGIGYADLSFNRSGNDLVLQLGAGEQISLQSWYASTNNRSVVNLQMIAEAMADFAAGGADPLKDDKVEQFDFLGLVNQFDLARAANPALTNWALSNALLDFHTGGSDSAALGGDLAYQYGLNRNLTGIGVAPALTVMSDPQFGVSAQGLQPTNSLHTGDHRLV
jgi:Ca2+-binding RTX toxin-like protein